MIAGTITLEDITLDFVLPERIDGVVVVNVSEKFNHTSATVRCSTRAFAASIALALDFEGMEGDCSQPGLYELAETITFPSRDLRWIP